MGKEIAKNGYNVTMHYKKDDRNGIFKIFLINDYPKNNNINNNNEKNFLIFSKDINDKDKSLIISNSAYDSKKDIINAILKIIQ